MIFDPTAGGRPRRRADRVVDGRPADDREARRPAAVDARLVHLAKYGEWIDGAMGGAAKFDEIYNVLIRITPTRGVTFHG